MKKLKISVKFCGGCNPRYDRGAAYRRIKEELEDKAEFTSDGNILIIIKGCHACDIESSYDKSLVVSSENDIENVIRILKQGE